jgi:Xaa-Pro dipeptidase
LINRLRIIKDENEIQLIHQAVTAAQNALKQTLPLIQVGMTEREIAAELTMQILRCSSGSELAFAPIIAAGINSANPHATPSDHKIAPGELLLIDWGAKIDDYLSDLTRTFAVCELPHEFKRIAQIVQDANQVGREAAKPGIPVHDIDFAVRSFIEKAGFGQYFFHRTGHGFGMDEHEEPYIRNGNQKILEAGMTFTIEPGIYLANKGGVRIEDDIMITSQEAISFSDMERSVMVVG